MNKLNPEEILISNQIKKLKDEAGSHSPSIFTFKQKLPNLEIKVDACFLSNPYATQLFLKCFDEEILKTNKIAELLEFYPSQNNVIAELLADFLKISAKNIIIGNGAIEIIQRLMNDQGVKKVLLNLPTFSSYYEFINDEAEVIYNFLKKEDDFKLNIQEYIQLIKTEKPDTIILINPNNPDSSYLSYDSIKLILNECREVANIIIDESFIHFAYEGNNFDILSIAELIKDYHNLIILKSMSKDFGIAGIRAGYAIMNEVRISKFIKNGFLWNSNGLAEYFFRLYTRSDFAESYELVRVQYILETIDFVEKLLTVKQIKIYPSKANFVLVELPQYISQDNFVALFLIRYGIYLRTCSDKIGLESGNFIRLASRTKEENNYVIDCFLDFFK
jgi:histidinol-phosphate/aromatic aminotransferase/cobyric acid decarboxylase-like protein